MRRRPAPKMAEGWASLDGDTFALDAVLPGQYHEGSALRTPEHALLLRVLEDGIRRHDDAWLFGDPTPWWPFDFTAVCEHLGIDPDALRRGIRMRRSRDEA